MAKSDSNNHKSQFIELTEEGLEELKQELSELKDKKLPEVIKRVATAREHGDLSENAEYHSAKEDQRLVETRIEEIEAILSKAKVVKQTKSHNKVGMGSTVSVSKKGDKGVRKLTIVGEFEADPTEGKIANNSPLGKALMGKKKGDVVKYQAPAGEIEYKIVDIE